MFSCKYLFTSLFILRLVGILSAQQKPSIPANLSQNLLHEELREGISFKQKRFSDTLWGNQSISYVEIDLHRAPIRLQVAYHPKFRIRTSHLADSIPGSIAAVNGTFFNMKEGGSVCFLKSNRKIINLTATQDTVWFVNAEGGIAVDTLGQIQILAQWELPDSSWLNTEGYEEIMTAGPILILHDSLLGLGSSYITRHPRTAVGITPQKQLILLTVDGRHPGIADGMTIPELTRLMSFLGCRDALNLDGGGSTTLWIRGKPNHGVVNYPSDNKKFDHEGERTVANALVIMVR